MIQDLKQMGYLIERENRKRQLYQKKALLERWITAYPEQLRPKLLINRYQSVVPNWWQQAQLNTNTYWGGEIAAAMLTHYLKPMIATVYIKQSVGEFVLKNRLRKMPQGEILETFWGFEYHQPPYNIVPPLLIYADLIATGNARNIETARIIYEKEIVGLIQAS
ncbi:MAG: type IV toxin-antitoxin system AbiEi family antitoxin [Pseudomonadota bacterium]